jgi:hypothetical protein
MLGPPQTEVAEEFALFRTERLGRNGRMPNVIVRLEEHVMLDTPIVKLLLDFIEVILALGFEEDQERDVARLLELRTSFES